MKSLPSDSQTTQNNDLHLPEQAPDTVEVTQASLNIDASRADEFATLDAGYLKYNDKLYLRRTIGREELSSTLIEIFPRFQRLHSFLSDQATLEAMTALQYASLSRLVKETKELSANTDPIDVVSASYLGAQTSLQMFLRYPEIVLEELKNSPSIQGSLSLTVSQEVYDRFVSTRGAREQVWNSKMQDTKGMGRVHTRLEWAKALQLDAMRAMREAGDVFNPEWVDQSQISITDWNEFWSGYSEEGLDSYFKDVQNIRNLHGLPPLPLDFQLEGVQDEVEGDEAMRD